jgi:ribosomal protein S18 acetylase RimI-like enzyme
MVEPSGIESLDVKCLGDLSRDVSDKIRSIQDNETTGHSTFSEISSELEALVYATGVDPEKFVRLVEKDDEYRSDIQRIKTRIAGIPRVDVDSSVVSSIVDSALTLELMKLMVEKAGSEDRLCEFLMSRYGIGLQDIALSHERLDIEVSRIENLEEFNKYFKNGLTDLGISRDEVFFPLTVMHTGVVLAAVHAGKIIGLLDLMYDRHGCGFIHNICVSKKMQGLGISSKLLGSVGNYVTERRVWSIVNTKNPGLLSLFFREGYVVTGTVNDFYAEQEDYFIVETTFGGNLQDNSKDFSDKIGKQIKIVEGFEEVDGIHATTVANFISNAEKFLQKYDAISLVKIRGQGDYIVLKPGGKREHDELNMISFEKRLGHYSIEVLESTEEITDAQEVDKESSLHYGESMHNLMLMSKVGVILGVSHEPSEELVGVSPMIFDESDGIYMKDISVKNRHPKERLRSFILGEVDNILSHYGRKRIWITVVPTNVLSTSLLLNYFGFTCRMLIMDYYGIGQHRLIAGKNIGEEIREIDYGPDTAYVKNYFNFKPSYSSCLLDINNYGLIKTVLTEGLEIVQVISREHNKKNIGIDRELFLLNRSR